MSRADAHSQAEYKSRTLTWGESFFLSAAQVQPKVQTDLLGTWVSSTLTLYSADTHRGNLVQPWFVWVAPTVRCAISLALKGTLPCSAFPLLDEGCPRCWALLHSVYTEEVGFCLHQVFMMHGHLSERRGMSPSYCEDTVASSHLGNGGSLPDIESVGLDLGHPVLGAMSSLWRCPVIATPEDHSRASSIFTGGQDLLVTLFPKTIHPSSSLPPPPSPNPSPAPKGPMFSLINAYFLLA